MTEEQPNNRLARALSLLLKLQQSDENRGAERDAVVDELSSLLALITTETFVRSTVAAWLSSFYNDQGRALELVNAGLLVDQLAAFLHSRKGEVLSDMKRFY